MKRSERFVRLLGVLLVALTLHSCGNATEDGSSPSGSILRIVSVTPDPEDAFTPDLYVSNCSEDVNTPEWESAPLFNSYVDVVLMNDSRPNMPEGKSSNSYVTVNRYRVDYAGLNKTVSIPSRDGGGYSVGIVPDGQGTMKVLVLDLAQLDYIRTHYPTVGRGEPLVLRCDVTIWGEDAFKANTKTEFTVTLVVDDYKRCGA